MVCVVGARMQFTLLCTAHSITFIANDDRPATHSGGGGGRRLSFFLSFFLCGFNPKEQREKEKSTIE